jgi:hypothetical protein
MLLNLSKHLAVLLLFFGRTCVTPAGQGNVSTRADELARELSNTSAVPGCKTYPESGMTLCETSLENSVGTRKNVAGEHLWLRIFSDPDAAERCVIMFRGTVVGIWSRSKDQPNSLLRIRIDRAVRKDGSDFPIEARIVALASQSSVKDEWIPTGIVADRFPRIPEDDQRRPGERKLSGNLCRSSPLDSVAGLPIDDKVVCNENRKKASQQNACPGLITARGVFGYKALKLEPARPDSPAESVLSSSSSNISFEAGTVLVLQLEKFPPAEAPVLQD